MGGEKEGERAYLVLGFVCVARFLPMAGFSPGPSTSLGVIKILLRYTAPEIDPIMGS